MVGPIVSDSKKLPLFFEGDEGSSMLELLLPLFLLDFPLVVLVLPPALLHGVP